MIIDKTIKIRLGTKNIRHYENLGYILPKGIDKRGRNRIEKEVGLIIKISDLPTSSNVKIKVQCEDCEKIREIPYNTLLYRTNSSYNKNGETLCSVCANKRMSKEKSGSYKHGNNHYSQYRYNANRRGINFDLTIDEFEKLIPSICYFCEEPSNGIDRWYSNIGYTIENTVPCCGKCNFIKNNTQPEEFFERIKKIYLSLSKKEFGNRK